MEAAVFLDFDGVICDSTLECLAVSWLAYYKHVRASVPAAIPRSLRESFSRLRPFARSGEDFVLFQELIDLQIEVRSQEEFDRECAARGQKLLRRYRDLFYSARAELLQSDRKYWIGLNRLYPHLREHLPSWSLSERFFILSTKRPQFIHEILSDHGITMDPERILHCARSGKLQIIARVMAEQSIRKALFIDDQIDHLGPMPERLPKGRGPQEQGRERTRIATALAAWGYVRQEWLSAGVEVLQPQELAPRLEPLLGR